SNMNKKQKYVLIIVSVVIFLMFLYPPFYATDTRETVSMGYHIIYPPPALNLKGLVPYSVSMINISTLLTQWLGVLIIGGITWLLVRDRK
ncbi:MAG: hypothetical protein KGQ83_08375, partial [Planctomycetes bacterium]|nr:hypothetical protein [Planctomycetota bacterium]